MAAVAATRLARRSIIAVGVILSSYFPFCLLVISQEAQSKTITVSVVAMHGDKHT